MGLGGDFDGRVSGVIFANDILYFVGILASAFGRKYRGSPPKIRFGELVLALHNIKDLQRRFSMFICDVFKFVLRPGIDPFLFQP